MPREVYRGNIYADSTGRETKHYISKAIDAGIVVDGKEMVRMNEMLVPASGFVPTIAEAQQQVITQLRAYVANINAHIARLEVEIQQKKGDQ